MPRGSSLKFRGVLAEKTGMRAATSIPMTVSILHPPVSGDEVDVYVMARVVVDTEHATLELEAVEEARVEYPCVGEWMDAPFAADLLEAVTSKLEEPEMLLAAIDSALED